MAYQTLVATGTTDAASGITSFDNRPPGAYGLVRLLAGAKRAPVSQAALVTPNNPAPGTGYTDAQIDDFLAAKASEQQLADLAEQVDAMRTTLPLTGARTADYTLQPGDAGCAVRVSSSNDVTITVSDHASTPMPIGSVLYVRRKGAGKVTIAAAAGVVVQSRDGYQVDVQDEISLHKEDLNTWYMKGGIS
jgi:hypothetical protein